MKIINEDVKTMIDSHKNWVYIEANPEGTDFVEQNLEIDAIELPTQSIDNVNYFVFCPADGEMYKKAWQFAKDNKVSNFNTSVENELISNGFPTWKQLKPIVDKYIANTNASEYSPGDYVYNLIDNLFTHHIPLNDYDELYQPAEDYLLNMIYSYEPFNNALDNTIEENLNNQPMVESVNKGSEDPEVYLARLLFDLIQVEGYDINSVAKVTGMPIEYIEYLIGDDDSEELDESGSDSLSNKQIAKILKDHSIDYEESGNKIVATGYFTTADGEPDEEKVDVTGWTVKKLRDWLGY